MECSTVWGFFKSLCVFKCSGSAGTVMFAGSECITSLKKVFAHKIILLFFWGFGFREFLCGVWGGGGWFF